MTISEPNKQTINHEDLLTVLLIDRILMGTSEPLRTESSKSSFYDLIDKMAYSYVGDQQLRLAKLEFNAGNYEDALDYAKTVVHLGYSTPQKLGMARKYAGISYFKLGKSEEGQKYLEEAISNFERNGMGEELQEVKGFLVDLLTVDESVHAECASLIAKCEVAIGELAKQIEHE